MEIERDEDIDYSDIPELDEAFFQDARLVMPDIVDKEVIQWFKKQYGRDYLSQMGTVLHQFMKAHS